MLVQTILQAISKRLKQGIYAGSGYMEQIAYPTYHKWNVCPTMYCLLHYVEGRLSVQVIILQLQDGTDNGTQGARCFPDARQYEALHRVNTALYCPYSAANYKNYDVTFAKARPG